MEELESKVAAVRRRLLLFRLFDWSILALIWSLVLVNLVMLALKLFENNVPVPLVSAIIVAAGLFAAVVASFVKRLTMFEAALAADASLNLRERLSSALVMAWSGTKPDAAFAALEEDARSYARTIRPGKDFRYRLPRYAKHTIWPALGIVALYFIPQMNILNDLMPVKDPVVVTTGMTADERKEEAERVRKVAKKAREKAEETLDAEQLQLAEKLERLAEDISLGQKDKKEAVAEMSRMNEEVKIQQRDVSKLMQPFRQIQGLQQADKTKELQRDLKNQDFEAAAEKMQEMAQKLSEMPADDMKELSEELQQLSESLKDNPQMAEALKQASEAVKQLAEQKEQQQGNESGQQQSQSQGEESGGEKSESGEQSSQQQQEQQQANQQGGSQGQQSKGEQGSESAQQAAAAAMQQAQQQMEQMQQAMTQMETLSELQTQMAMAMSQSMSQGSSPGQQGQQGQEGGQEGAGGQPGQMGEPGMGQCEGGSCDGSCGSGNCQGSGNGNQPGDGSGMGVGPGGAGTGMGRRPESAPGQVEFVDTFIPGQKNEGEIIAVFEVDALVPAGESRLDHTRVPAQIQQRAADAMVDNEIPVGLRTAVKDYFQAVNLSGSN